MIGTLFSLSVAGAAGGALALPAVRRRALGDITQDWLAGELELDHIEADGMTVVLKDGGRFRVFAITGESYDTRPEAVQTALLRGRASLWHQLLELGVTVRLTGVKRKKEIPLAGDWPSPTLGEIGEQEAGLFRASYAIHWFLLIQASEARAMVEASVRIANLLASYSPTALCWPDDLTDACPLTGFLNHLLCGELRTDLPAMGRNLSGNLPAADISFTPEGLITTHGESVYYHRIIAIRGWPESVSGAIAHEVMALPGEIELCQVCLPTAPEKTRLGLLRKQQELQVSTALGGGSALAEEITATLDLMSEGQTSLFATQYQITVRATSPEALEELTLQVTRLLARRRVLYSLETTGAPICWFNRIPGTSSLLRPLKLLNDNIAALWPFAHSPTGQTRSPWGDKPVRLFRTPSGQAYAFQFHVSDKPQALGHYLVFAPSGSGKSTLIMHLLGGLAKLPGIRSYVFDSNEGTRFMIEAFGGEYQSFDRLALNPLDVGAESQAARLRVGLVLRAMLGETPCDDEVLAHALDLIFKIDAPERTLNEVHAAAFPARSEMRKAMARWVTDEKGARGLYADVFNAPHDSLAGMLETFLVGINMNEALGDPDLGPPVVAHISAAISKVAAARARGFNIFIDEAANLLQNPGFRTVVQEMFREYRKLNGVVGMAFQDPEALARSGIAEAVLQNVSTLLFFPNALGTRQGYEPFNLNDEQLAFILGGAQSGRNVLLVKRDPATGWDESVILDIDLAPFGEALRFYRSGADAVRELVAVQQTHGEAQWRANI